jgi:hypothetical protein
MRKHATNSLIVSAVVLASSLAGAARADVLVFTDPVLFQAEVIARSLTSAGVEDFESATLVSSTIDDPVDAMTASPVFMLGDILDGIRIQSNLGGAGAATEAPRGPMAVFIRGPGSGAVSVVVNNNYQTDSLDLIFLEDFSAVGFAFTSLFPSTLSTSGGTVFDAAGQQIKSFSAPSALDGTAFVGLVATAGEILGRVNVDRGSSSSGFVGFDEIEPFRGAIFAGDVTQLSVSAGGTQNLTMTVGVTHAAKSYLILGSATGTAPGFPYAGQLVPLNPDAYMVFTLLNPNTPPLLGSGGLLDAFGSTSAAFTLPPLSDPGLVGLQVNHAGVVLSLGGGAIAIDEVTIPASLDLVP